MKWKIIRLKNNSVTDFHNLRIEGIDFITNDNFSFAIKGFIVPRNSYLSEFVGKSQEEMLTLLISKYGLDFIYYIKGSFTIILLLLDSLHIFNDPHGMRKFFYSEIEGKIVISESLDAQKQETSLSINNFSIVTYYLFEHFVNSWSPYADIGISGPATHLSIRLEDRIKVSNYWKPSSLLNKNKSSLDIRELTEIWSETIQTYIDFLGVKKISTTLTGGNDSRMILSGLLNKNIELNTFTFGDPSSSDGSIVNQIVGRIGLKHSFHHLPSPSPEWFNDLASEIISIGDGLINIHRAHRLWAIKQEKKSFNPELVMGGFMGGDYVKGLIYDDYITTKLMRKWLDKDVPPQQKITEHLQHYGVTISNSMLEEVTSIISQLPFLNTEIDDTLREFYFLFYVVGTAHDYQDTYLFNSEVKFVVNPYMDIDFMEALFSSPYSMLSKNKKTDSKWKRLFYPEFHVKITNNLAPQLSDIPYAKKGQFSAREYLGNKYVYALKRQIRYKHQPSYPQSFPLGDWFRVYCMKEMCNIRPELLNLIDVEGLVTQLASQNHPTTEGYWHLYTNLINLNKIYKGFENVSV